MPKIKEILTDEQIKLLEKSKQEKKIVTRFKLNFKPFKRQTFKS